MVSFNEVDEEKLARLGRKQLERLYLYERELAMRNSEAAQEALDKLGDLRRKYNALISSLE